jgi:nucleoside-diphosphate-sugar epimerase
MYQGQPILITGGLGFIGSNLALRLAAEGADVRIVDASIEGCGANPFNISPAADRIRILPFNIGEPERFKEHIASAKVIFNLAGEISHIDSMRFPERDLELNTAAQLRFLLACAAAQPGARIIYAGTRQVYGVPESIPVDERHAINPVDFNGVHKAAATLYHQVLSRTGQIDATIIRLTNVYGPRMALDRPQQGFLSTFLRRLLLNQTLAIFGDGTQLRDPVFVDDAVEAFVLAGRTSLPERVYNVGGPESLSLRQIAESASAIAGVPVPSVLPFPDAVRPIDIGSYVTDWSRIRESLGWRPRVAFEDGFRRTLAYYRENLDHYLPGNP